jgi:hypothetical protein
MKKTMLITMLVLLGTLGFTTTAQAVSCSDVIWSAEMLESNPNIANACQEVVDKRGTQAVKLHARVVRQSVNSTVVQWQLPDGSWSSAERRYPARGATAEIQGQTVRISDMAPRQEVNVYVPQAGNWSLPAPPVAAAAAPPPPPPARAPEPEPEPVALPTTATQVPLFALLGGLFILLGGAVSFARTRL